MTKRRKKRRRNVPVRQSTYSEKQSANNPRSDMLGVLRGDETNLQGSISLFHQLGILDHYERMFLLFDSLSDNISGYYKQTKRHPLIRTDKNGVDAPAWDFLLRFFMTLSARQQLFFATGHLLRGHITEIAGHIRHAIEGAGIAYLSKTEPDLGEIFHRNDRREFSRRTPKDKILPESDPLASDLREEIDIANRLTHNNFESFAIRMKHDFSTDEKKWSFGVMLYYHEIDPDDMGHFLRTALWMLRVGERLTRACRIIQ